MQDLRLTHIRKKYADRNSTPFELQVASLCISKGSMHTLLGKSGCGKTTLLRAIAGLVDLDAGKLSLGTHDITHLPPEKRHVGMVFQKPLLFPHMTVLENVAIGLIHVLGKKAANEAATEMLERVGLTGLEQRMPRQLSGGQAQRAALARALVLQPEVLLMDEPFGALDVDLKKEIMELVKTLKQRMSCTIIFVTHDLREALALSDDVTVMDSGRIIETGPVEQIFNQPECLETALMMNFENIMPIQDLPMEIKKTLAFCDSKEYTAFRAKHVEMIAERQQSLPPGYVEAVVLEKQLSEEGYLYKLDTGFAHVFSRCPSAGIEAYNVGQKIGVKLGNMIEVRGRKHA